MQVLLSNLDTFDMITLLFDMKRNMKNIVHKNNKSKRFEKSFLKKKKFCVNLEHPHPHRRMSTLKIRIRECL